MSSEVENSYLRAKSFSELDFNLNNIPDSSIHDVHEINKNIIEEITNKNKNNNNKNSNTSLLEDEDEKITNKEIEDFKEKEEQSMNTDNTIEKSKVTSCTDNDIKSNHNHNNNNNSSNKEVVHDEDKDDFIKNQNQDMESTERLILEGFESSIENDFESMLLDLDIDTSFETFFHKEEEDEAKDENCPRRRQSD
eukprot:Pgem_evm1s9197